MQPEYPKAGVPQYVMVGSGIASLMAAESLRERHPKAQITLVSEEPYPFYSRPGLAYLLRGDIPEWQLSIRSAENLANLNVTRIHDRVDEVLCDRRELVLASGKRVGYDRLLLATGALAVPPPFPTDNLTGIVKLDSLNDARNILKLARRGRCAVVIGGGITALEIAEGLNAQGMEVHYFLRGDRYWTDILDETESHIVMRRLEHEGITLHLNTEVQRVCGQHGQITGVETKAGEIVFCDLLAIAIGVKPRVDLAVRAGLTVDRGVLVNSFLQTSQPEIFAAGDAAQVGNTPLDVLWPTALEQGRVAGLNMAGANVPYAKGVPCNVTMLTGLKVTLIGTIGRRRDQKADPDLVTISRGDSESWRLLPNAYVLSDQDDVNRIRLFVGEKKIVGALVMGDQTWSRPLQQLIGAEVDISAIRPALIVDCHTGLEELARFYREWLRSGRKSGVADSK
jgi:NAD(P)H-nitrite reductase large subunit